MWHVGRKFITSIITVIKFPFYATRLNNVLNMVFDAHGTHCQILEGFSYPLFLLTGNNVMWVPATPV